MNALCLTMQAHHATLLCGSLAVALLGCAIPQLIWLIQGILDRPTLKALAPPAALFACNAVMQAVLLDAAPLYRETETVPLTSVCALAAASGALALATAALCRRAFSQAHAAPTRYAIQESINNLPAGMLFYGQDGRCHLTNKVMLKLCQQLANAPLLNGALLWEKLESAQVNATRVADGARPVYRLENGTCWQFTRSTLHVDGTLIWQLVADPVTQQQHVNDQLQQTNQQLHALAKRLTAHNKQVTDLTRNKEILRTKTQIHDQVGHALIATRAFLKAAHNQQDEALSAAPSHAAEPAPRPAANPTLGTAVSATVDSIRGAATVPTADPRAEERRRLLATWQQTIALLRNEATAASIPQASALDAIAQAGSAIGLQVVTTGRPPAQNSPATDLIIAAAREAMTNAVKHAQASTLTLAFSPHEDGLMLQIINDGAQPDQPVTESGGLQNLRATAQAAGATMTLRYRPCFMIELIIPVEGGFYV